MYATDGQTDRRTDGRTKATLIAPFPTGEGIIIKRNKLTRFVADTIFAVLFCLLLSIML